MNKLMLSGIAVGFAAALSATTALADVLIATAGPITGQLAALGEQYRQGASKAVADINAAALRSLRDELGIIPHARGTIGMSTGEHDTGDGQWFFNLRDNLRLNRDYTVFAEVTQGIDVVDGILEGDRIAKIEVIAR